MFTMDELNTMRREGCTDEQYFTLLDLAADLIVFDTALRKILHYARQVDPAQATPLIAAAASAALNLKHRNEGGAS